MTSHDTSPSARPPPFADNEPVRRVLVVDDEPTVRDIVARYLERDGFRVTVAADAREALFALQQRPDLIILDIMLPGEDGLTILQQLRKSSDVPVILLTARTDEPDRIVGLELGADDYVTKPFSPRELVARVRSVMRRMRVRPVGPRLEFGGLLIETAAREVHVDGRLVGTRAREFELLAFLAASPRQVFSRAQLLEHVWNSSAEYHDISTVTVHIRRLRQKIEADPMRPRWITTVWGIGYRFEP
ncbi:MAG: response regulator transcription factor [Chloroflexi bacterium]|nr:response regulator transcription factor [Chloroflexota bacterium]